MEYEESLKRPNFFIIGAPKCGTTSMAAWLAEHPNIYMSPVKEPWFFSSDINFGYIKTWDEYMRLFDRVSYPHVRIGEGSVFYLFSKAAIPAIEEKLANPLYIVMLRNPVEMVYSLHCQHLREFIEVVEDFEEAWRLAPERRAGRCVPPRCPDPILLDYPAWCSLGKQLERLYSLVPEERVLVLLLDDVKENPRREYLKVLDFLKVPDDGRREFPVHNPARQWRLKGLVRIARGIRITAGALRNKVGIEGFGLGWLARAYESWNERLNTRRRPSMPLRLRRELTEFFADDVRLLEKLLNRDLSPWLDVRPD